MDLGLRGRVALVTGSSDGMGREIAFRLAEEGAEVIVHGRDPLKIASLTSLITISHRVVTHCCIADVYQSNEIERWFKEIMPSIGKLDILVNNIGGKEGIRRFEEITPEEWRATFEYNQMSTVRFTQLALPYLKKSNQARIINMATMPALEPGFKNPDYGAAKAGLVNLNKYLSTDLAEYGILVNAVVPNTIKNSGSWFRNMENMVKREGVSLEEAEKVLEKSTLAKVPLKRIGLPHEVASAVLFLASKQASFITGNCLFVDGGTKKSMF